MLRGGAGDVFHPRRLPRGERGVWGGAPGGWGRGIAAEDVCSAEDGAANARGRDRSRRPQRALVAAGERAGVLLEPGEGFGAR